MTRGSLPPRSVYLVFFLSGAASLADEVVWFKWLNLIFGSTTAATATLLAVFMGGLAAGSGICAKFAPRLARPQWLYAVLEGGVALYAIATPLLFSGIDAGYVWAYRHLGESGSTLLAIRVLLATAALLPPTLLMGATFPALSRIVESRETPGRRSAALYGINTAGALIGTAACGFWLIPSIGLRATLSASAIVSLIAALAATTMSPGPVPAPVPRRPTTRRLLWSVAALTGACAMADEVIWTRILVLRLGSSVYAFSLMLTLYLTGLVLGSLAGAAVAPRDLRRAIAFGQAGLAATILLQVIGFSSYTRILVSVATNLFHAGTWTGLMVAQALTTTLYLLPPTFLMGLSFALIVREASGSGREAPAEAGAVYAVNTVGGIVGALATGFVAIPLAGSQVSLLATGFLGTIAAFALAPRARWTRAAPPLFALLAWLPGRDSVILTAGVFADVPREDVLFYDEDITGTIAVKNYRGTAGQAARSLELNGVNVAGTTPDLLVIQKLQGHLPLALAREPRRVVHIGLGSGGTAYSVSRHAVSQIRIVEISPEVVSTAARFFTDVNHGVLTDPRVRVTVNDGRNFLLATRESFDAILSDSIHPRYAGNGSLYTEDYFRLCAKRLAPGGVISMWLPMYSLRPEDYRSIVRAFRDVFPNVSIWYPHSVLNSFTIVLATPGKTVRLDDLQDRLRDPPVHEDLARIGADDPAELLSYLLLAPDDVTRWVAETFPHMDDRPWVEYESGRILAQTGTWLATFSDLAARRSHIEDFIDGLSPGDPRSQRILARFQSSQQILARHRGELLERVRREP